MPRAKPKQAPTVATIPTVAPTRRRAPSVSLRWRWNIVFVVVLFVAGVNGLVRLTGGAPFLLSPLYMPQKIEALLRLAAHLPRHLVGACGEERTRLLREAALRRRVPPEFVVAIAKTESNFGPHRISSTGAMGVMQLIPSRARLEGVEDPFEASENIKGGAQFLATLWRRYGGDRRRVAAAYNAGPGRVPTVGALNNLPSETRTYVERVLEHERTLGQRRQSLGRGSPSPRRTRAHLMKK